MILVGRYLSPFTRRTAIVMKTLNISFEVKSLAATPENDELVAINPLARVPALVLDDGEVLIDSAAIIDHLLEIGDPDHTLLAAAGGDRRAVMRLVGIAQGTMEKTVGVVYEQIKRPEGSHHQPWLDQLRVQASAGFDYLEKATAGRVWLHGDGLTLADVNAVVAYDFAGYLPFCEDLVAGGKYPALAELSARCNALRAFTETAWSG
ncbi:MAG: glutathione S-transferase family protein [Rhodospirillaceae bacterium]